jgi:hypothetical protein
MTIENIPEPIMSGPTHYPRMTEINPDIDPDTLGMVVAYSYPCTYCNAPIGEACIRHSDNEPDNTTETFPKRARFPHATRGTDYIPRAARQNYLDRTKELIIAAVDRIVAEMVAAEEADDAPIPF